MNRSRLVQFYPINLIKSSSTKGDRIFAKLRKLPPPQIRKVEETIIKSIEKLMRDLLENTSMSIEDKKEIIQKTIRLSSGL